MKKLITTLSALALASTLSFAEDKPPGGPKGGGPGGEGGKRPSPEEILKKLDTNSDGTVSVEEFKAGPMAQRNPDKAGEAFKHMDKDGDGKLTATEIKEGRPEHGPGGGKGGPEGGKGGKGGPEGGKRGPKPGGEGAPKPPGQ